MCPEIETPVVVETPVVETPITPPVSETVSKAEFDKVMAELHKHKKTVGEIKAERESEKLARMKEEKRWEEIATTKEREAQEANAKAERLQNSYLGERKYAAVRERCLALGIRQEVLTLGDLETLDMESVSIETTSTGKINVLGADKFAERLKAQRPFWFSEPKAPAVNSSGSRVLDENTDVTVKDLMTAETEARKSGDSSKYLELHKRFQAQRSRK